MFSRKKKFFVLSLALLCISCLIFAGCSSKNNTSAQNPPTTGNQTDSNDQNSTNNNASDNPMSANDDASTDDKATGNGTTGGDQDDSALSQRAEKIAEAVTNDVDAVQDTRTVISDKMAYVSVQISETADTAQSAALKEEITEVVKKTDREIETVYVMEDADTFTRMKEIGDDIADGKPISGFVDELENLFVRVTPSAK